MPNPNAEESLEENSEQASNQQHESEFLSAGFQSLAPEDIDNNGKVLRGYVMAMEGPFVDGRGSFEPEGLKAIADMVNSNRKGLKSRWGHPTPFDDGLGYFLGRAKNARMATTLNREGNRVAAVRGDLHLDPSSFHAPSGDLGGYLLRLAASDSDAISSSLEIRPRREPRGSEPSAWYPLQLRSSDIVAEGAATAGLLGNATAVKNKLHELLNLAFKDENRESVEEFLAAYVIGRFGEPTPSAPAPLLEARRLRMDEMKLLVGKIREAG